MPIVRRTRLFNNACGDARLCWLWSCGAGTQAVLWQHATPMRVHNDVFLPNFLTILTLARPKYELPDDGHRPKHVGVFYYEF